MKKIVIIVVFVLTATLSFGQNKSVEEMAEANTKEMVEVLSLNADQEAAIYKINLDKNRKLEANKANKSLSNEEMKVNRKAIYKKAQNDFREAIGKEKVKEWNVFKNAQTAARKNKN